MFHSSSSSNAVWSLVLKVLSKGTSTDYSTISTTFLGGCWIQSFLQGTLFPLSNFFSFLFTVFAYSPTQYAHFVSMSRSIILGWMRRALKITIQLIFLSSSLSLCYTFEGIRALIVQALQTSFYIFLRFSPDWPQASFIIIKKKTVLMFSMRS